MMHNTLIISDVIVFGESLLRNEKCNPVTSWKKAPIPPRANGGYQFRLPLENLSDCSWKDSKQVEKWKSKQEFSVWLCGTCLFSSSQWWIFHKAIWLRVVWQRCPGNIGWAPTTWIQTKYLSLWSCIYYFLSLSSWAKAFFLRLFPAPKVWVSTISDCQTNWVFLFVNVGLRIEMQTRRT